MADRSFAPGVAPSMTIIGRLALLFVVIPLVELAFLIQVGRWVGVWPTVGLVFLTGIVGALLARAEGLRTLWAFRGQLAGGELPGQPLLDGLCILVGGALLLTPGFVTDLAGFSLLLPPTRRLIQKGIKRRLRRGIEEGSIRVMTGSDIFGPGGFGPGGSGEDRSGGPGFRGHRGPGGEGGDRWSSRGVGGESEAPGARTSPDERELDPEKEISQ